jgi:hypothetical protein
MTKFCIVAPVNILKGLEAHGMLGIHHLLLAHDIVIKEHSQEYVRIFGQRRWDDSELVILDNSVVETGNAVDLGMIADAIAIVQPTCVVLPDVLLNASETIIDCRKALDEWPKKLGDATKYMYVPQGNTIMEFIECATVDWDLHFDERITHWGVPRNLVKQMNSKSRALAIKMLYELNPNRKIHMLGFSDYMRDDFACASFPEVHSIDSAVPLRLNVPIDLNVVVPPRGDWWEKAHMSPMVLQNLNQVRMWLNPTKFP